MARCVARVVNVKYKVARAGKASDHRGLNSPALVVNYMWNTPLFVFGFSIVTSLRATKRGNVVLLQLLSNN